MIDAADLKPCPSCGTKHGDGYIGVYFVDENAASLACHKCGYETGPCVGKDYDETIRLACDRWNRRPIEDALQAENKRLCEALELIKKTGNEYPHDGNGCAYIAELALCGLNVIEEWEKIGREADEE